jgi:type II secretory pathway component PulJ
MRIMARDDGMTFPELSIVVLLMAIAGAFFYTFLFSVQRSVGTQEQRSENNDAVRLAIERLDREVRSGNVLYNPQNEASAAGVSAANYALRVYTQSNQAARCVQWRVKDGRLERRSWTPNAPPSDLPWHLVTEGLVNEQRSVAPFVLDSDPSTSGRTVVVEFVAGASDNLNEVARIKTSITGRNTTFNYPVAACETPPPA